MPGNPMAIRRDRFGSAGRGHSSAGFAPAVAERGPVIVGHVSTMPMAAAAMAAARALLSVISLE